MKLKLEPVTNLLPAALKVNARDGLLFQRLFWGAMAGCLATLLLAESPVLGTMELSMLEWRYQVADKIARFISKPATSKDISLVDFNDESQYDLRFANFSEEAGQEALAQAIDIIEKGEPTMVVIDLNLHGNVNAHLVDALRQKRNVILALFGSLEASSELPSEKYLKAVASYGYDDISPEPDGLICKLPLNYKGMDNLASYDSGGMAPVPSLTEATVDFYRRVKGVGPPSQFFSFREDQPLFFGYRKVEYPTVSLSEVTQNTNFNPAQFKDRIVIIGSTLTQKHNEVMNKSIFGATSPDLTLHADSISTLLNDEVIYSFPRDISHHILLLIGAAFGAIASILPLFSRSAAYLGISILLVAVAQLFFQLFHLDIPVAPPLAVLTICFSLGTFIYLDTDLRLRNRELAKARESMQVRAEEERQRIAEDLHDETLPALSSVARMADRLSQELVDNPVPSLMRTKLDHAVAEMRRVINDLHPSVLETMGFKPALENLVAILSSDTGIDGKFEDGDGRSDYNLPTFTRLQLYRIVQEALNNVQKHSEATTVELLIREKDGYVFIFVADNGKGINLKAVRRDSHGLLNIRQRAQLIGAQVEWKKPEQFVSGTEMRLKIPFIEDAQIEGE